MNVIINNTNPPKYKINFVIHGTDNLNRNYTVDAYFSTPSDNILDRRFLVRSCRAVARKLVKTDKINRIDNIQVTATARDFMTANGINVINL